ncbi:MAG: hypothetical protein IPO92_24095 [Saprospiraceae bacterium]|nr:hypothetical protein [Saprospiraceae bacterium]
MNCTENNEVIHYKTIGGAHSWPGSIIQIGVTNLDFNAVQQYGIFKIQHEQSYKRGGIDHYKRHQYFS